MTTAATLATTIRERYQEEIRSKIKRYPQHTNRASSLGHPCEMRGYLDRTAWDKAVPVSESLQRIFERGNALEPVIRRMLEDLGIRLTGEQLSVKWDHFQISGHNDYRVADTDRYGRVIVEIKTTGNPQFAKATCSEDLLKSELGEKWYAQVQLYMLLGEYEQALIVILDVLTWQLVVLPLELNYEYAETLLRRAERINEAIAANDGGRGLRLINNPKICRRCQHFGVSCAPSVEFGEGVNVLADPELEAKLNRRGELEAGAKEFADLDEEVKAVVKSQGESVICGDWIISNSQVTQKRAKVPPGVAAKYQTEITYIKSSIQHLHPSAEKGDAS